MPRIYTSSNDPLDFCRAHFPSEKNATEKYGDVRKTGEGPDGRGNCFTYDADHPSYSDDDYECASCGKRLTDKSA